MTRNPVLPRLRLAFYGDDFTGSTDAMEVLAREGVRTVLFLRPPTPEDLARFPGLEAVGVAGMSRTFSPARMQADLRPQFQAIKALGAQICHYKVCSTFDSSPTLGSIGCAIDIAQDVFGSPWVPMVVGAPRLRRYQVFGHLFAGFGDDVCRLDRHPTMSRHPVTPMHESDLLAHLSQQTKRSLALFDILGLSGTTADVDARLQALVSRPSDVILFDVLDEDRLAEVGRLIWTEALRRPQATLFSASSSGLQYALVGHWKQKGDLPSSPSILSATTRPVDQVLALSGSCSPQTESQISFALANGFVGVDVDAPRLLDPASQENTRLSVVRTTLELLQTGNSVLLYSARGPDDPRIADLQRLSDQKQGDPQAFGRRLGDQLGRLLRAVLAQHRPPRLVIAGGDTSGFVAQALGIQVLEPIAQAATASPLCRTHATDPDVDGLEILMKGGQIGKLEYFVSARTGIF